MGLTESPVHFSPGYLEKFSQKKMNFIGSSQTWYQMKGMVKIREKSLINVGSRMHHLAVGPVSMSKVRPETLLCRVCELLNIDKFSTEIEILSDQAETWPGPQSRIHMSWGCELGHFGHL